MSSISTVYECAAASADESSTDQEGSLDQGLEALKRHQPHVIDRSLLFGSHGHVGVAAPDPIADFVIERHPDWGSAVTMRRHGDPLRDLDFFPGWEG